MTTTTKLTYATLHDADLDTLTDELAAAGWDSTQTERRDAMEAVARLMHETQTLVLCDAETCGDIRPATVEEAIESAFEGPEGYILVDGRKCYVERSVR